MHRRARLVRAYYVDEAGNRTTIVDADHALTSAAVVAPSGPHLAAVVPLVSCRRSCSGTGAPAPLTVHDVDRGVSYAVGSTTATALEFLFQSGFNDYPVTWSSDGTWLFFPEQNADGSPVTRAWRPGLLAPVEITNLQLSSLLGRGGSVVFPGDTPMPAPAG